MTRKNHRSLEAAIIYEFAANCTRVCEIARGKEPKNITLEERETIGQGALTLLGCLYELCGDVWAIGEMNGWQTIVKILAGKRGGQIGRICGTIEGRSKQIAAGLTKVIVKSDTGEYYTTEITNIRELTIHERILLGIE